MKLWLSGLLDDINVVADKGTACVIVRITIKVRTRIGAVEIRGNKELNNSKINEALEKDKIDLHVGNTIDQTLVQRAAESIKRAYSDNGYEGVTVEPTTESMNTPGDKKIIFNINEGIKAAVATIRFVGNRHFSNRQLLRQMKDVKETGLIS